MQAGSGFGGVRKAALEALLCACAGDLLVLFERFLKALGVHLQPVFVRELQRELDGEAEGIVKAERADAVDNFAGQPALQLFEFAQALTDGAREALFLQIELGDDAALVAPELGVDAAVLPITALATCWSDCSGMPSRSA